MFRTHLFILLLFISFADLHSQRRRNRVTKTIKLNSSINYSPSEKSFDFFGSVTRSNPTAILTFLTPVSGTFIIDDIIRVNTLDSYTPPSQHIDLGLSLQILRSTGFFQEISLTRLSFQRSKRKKNFEITYSDREETELFITGYKQKAFVLGLKYEFGKYFGDLKEGRLNYGISAGLEPLFYFYHWGSYRSNEFPIHGNVLRLNLSLSQNLQIKLSRSASIELRLMPYLELGSIISVKQNDFNLPQNGRGPSNVSERSDVEMAGSILFRYTIKEPRRRRNSG